MTFRNFRGNLLAAPTYVTVVRRKTVLEEVVIPFEEFNKIDEKDDRYWSELEYKESEYSENYELENTYYTAYKGDVTDHLDDVVNWIAPDTHNNTSWCQINLMG